MLETGIVLVIAVILIIAIIYIISIWIYKRAPSNMGFIRTGFLGTKVCLGKGALVLPVFHEVSWVSLETIKLIISRAREQAILTSDKIRVDVVAELYTHVGHTEADVLTASRSLGEKTFDAEKVRNLLEAKVIGALRSYAATKTLTELHENRIGFAQEIRNAVTDSFLANGLNLEEVTIVSLEQTGKEFFKSDNVFDAEGLKIITAITSEAKRKVHETEKRTTVSIRQKDLDTQLELLEIEKNEAFARANQDKAISNEQAQQMGEKQIFILDQRKAVEEREIENDVLLERARTDRELALTEEAQKREASEIKKALILEQERRDKEIALIEKAKEEELSNIHRNLELEKAERDRQIDLIEKANQQELAEIRRSLAREQAEKDKEISLTEKERQRQEAEIQRVTAVTSEEEKAKVTRHEAQEAAALAMRERELDIRMKVLDIEKQEAFASVSQEQEVSNRQAQSISEKQRFILEQRLAVEREEIAMAEAVERAQILKEAAIIEESKQREAAEIRRALARELEERDREIALVAKAKELEIAEIERKLTLEQEDKDRQVAIAGKEAELKREQVRQALTVELEERTREIALIEKEKEREQADIRRFLSRELEERDREIALVAKTRELEQSEIEKLETTAKKEQVEHEVESIRVVADVKREKEIEVVQAEKLAETRRIEEENKAAITRLHMLTQSETRKKSAEQDAEATRIRAQAASDAQKVSADGIEREAGAKGRAEMEIENLKAEAQQRMLEAEASGLEAKAEALKKYNDAATFLELAKMHIEAERDIHIDQAKAMGTALSGAQIRMYGGEGGTVDTIRGMFTQGFGLGEILEGVAQSLPEGIRDRFTKNGVRGLLGRPWQGGDLRQAIEHLDRLVSRSFSTKKSRDIPLIEAVQQLEKEAGDDAVLKEAVAMLRSVNENGDFDGVSFETVWSFLKAMGQTSSGGGNASNG